MRMKKYYLMSVCILNIVFIQNISAAFLGGSDLLQEHTFFMQDEDRIDIFLIDSNKRGYQYLSEVIELVKSKNNKGVERSLNKAKNSFVEALRKNPNSISYNGLIKASLIMQDYKQAQRWLQRALSFDNNNIETRYLQAKLLIINNRFAEAKIFLKDIVQIRKSYKLAYLSLAEIAVKEKEYSKAEEYYRDLLLLGGRSVNIYTNLAGLYTAQNKPEKAEATLVKGYEYFKQNSADDAVNIAVVLSKHYVVSNMPEKALQLSRSVFETYGDNDAALDLLLDILVINNHQADAEAILFDRVSNNRGAITPRLKLIILLSEKLSNMPKVVVLFEEIISIDKSVPSLYVTYARFLMENKAYKDANAVISRAITQFSEVGFTDVLMAELSAIQNDMKRSSQYYLSAYKKNKGNNLLVKVVQSLVLIDQKAVAIKMLNQEVKATDSISARMLLAGIYFSDKELDKAEQKYREVLAKNPSHFIALNDLGWLLIQKNKYKEAFVFAEKAYFMEPTSDEIKNTYSTVLNHLGFTEKAAEILSK